MKIHLSQLTIGEKVESEIGELEVISNFSENEKVYIELRKVDNVEQLIKE